MPFVIGFIVEACEINDAVISLVNVTKRIKTADKALYIKFIIFTYYIIQLNRVEQNVPIIDLE